MVEEAGDTRTDREQQNIDFLLPLTLCSFVPRPRNVLLDQRITSHQASRAGGDIPLDRAVTRKNVGFAKEESDDVAFVWKVGQGEGSVCEARCCG